MSYKFIELKILIIVNDRKWVNIVLDYKNKFWHNKYINWFVLI